MFDKRKIYEVTGTNQSTRDEKSPASGLERAAVTLFTRAFFASHSSLEFGEKIDEFVDKIIIAYAARHGRNHFPAEVMLHLIPNDLLDRLPLDYGSTRITTTEDPLKIQVMYWDQQGAFFEDVLEKKDLLQIFAFARQRFQKALIEKGQAHLHVVDKQPPFKPSLQRLHSGKIFKSGKMRRFNIELLSTALEALFQLPERSPYLLYPNTTIDAQLSDRDDVDRLYGDQIQTEVDLLTLKECIDRESISMPRALLIIADAIRGLIFLAQHDLRLSDLDASNIGVDPKTGRGVLFDYDGLRESGEESYYLAKSTHIPPEIVLERDQQGLPTVTTPVPLREKYQVYEIGQTLEEIFFRYSSAEKPRYWQEHVKRGSDLNRLIARMTHSSSSARPALTEVLRTLNEIQAVYREDLLSENFAEDQAEFTPTLVESPRKRTQRGYVVSA
jgi:hypothetical protein